MKVLITDHSPMSRRVLKRLLWNDGHTVFEALEGGEEIVQRFIEQKPDCVILEMTLPQSDGMKTLGAIRQLDADARVVMVAPDASSDEVQRALKAGARDFLIKPIEAARLERALPYVRLPDPMKILIADESPVERRFLGKLLREQGHTVFEAAEGGQEVIQSFIALGPDCVMLEMNLPQSDGMETLASIRELDSEAEVVMMSPNVDADEVKSALDAGARDFLIKPIEPSRLERALPYIF